MRNAVNYKGMWLVKNSTAYALHEAGDFKKLDQHLKKVQAEYDALLRK